MCGRYYVDDETAKEIEKIVREIDTNLRTQGKHGEIFPTQAAPIIHAQNNAFFAEQIHWGFPRFNAKGVLINARAETILERPTFRKSTLERRCVIPARNFFEWDSQKQKQAFVRPDNTTMYMAGIYNSFKGEKRFVIITTQANASVSPIHDRMPLILERDEIENWIFDDDALEFLLHKTPVPLKYNNAATS